MITHIISNSFHIFRELGSFGVFLSMFIENIGIPLPTEIGYLLGQELIITKQHSWLFIVFILTIGHTAGALLSYSIGRWGNDVVSHKIQGNKKIIEVHDKLNAWYKKYGNTTVFITRFVGYVRPWSSYVAGFAGIDFWSFLVWTFVGSLIFNVMSLYFTKIFILIWRRYEILHLTILLVGFIFFFGFLIYEAVKFLTKSKIKN